VNYYEHHLGDYMRDTAHLSMLEDAAYRRLLDAYYVRERALPADLRECYKLARASTKPEREAVAYVLREFFTLGDDGHHQGRADAEIARFKAKSEKARASINTRWERTRAEAKTNNERSTNVQPTGYERTTDDIHRAPVPSNQTPVTNNPPPPSGVAPPLKPAKAKAIDCPDGVAAQTWADWTTLRKAKKAPITATVLDNAIAEAGKAGMTLDAFLRVWCARGSQGLQADWIKPTERAQQATSEPLWRQEQRSRVAAFAGPAAARQAAKPTTTAEVIDVTPRLVG
jgi:uncharacterized protein YdaU (DUF1376 family)